MEILSMNKFIAFTLAETLIVMGIIGVVAALTLPNLNSSTGEKEKVAKVKKIYSNLNDAMGRAQAIYGAFDEWTLNDSSNEAKVKRVGERLTEFMKVSKNCGTNSTQTCVSSDYSNSNYYKFINADGSSIAIAGKPTYNSWSIIVDIDGLNKGSNKIDEGKEIFIFYISDNGEIIPGGTDYLSSNVPLFLASRCNPGTYAPECTAWVIQYDNMDYLKCHDSLSDNKTSCK